MRLKLKPYSEGNFITLSAHKRKERLKINYQSLHSKKFTKNSKLNPKKEEKQSLEAYLEEICECSFCLMG